VTILPDAAGQLGLAIQPGHGGRRHRALGQAPVEDQRAQDQRHRGPGVLASDIEQQLALLGQELATTAAIRARARSERGEAALPVGVQPTLERRFAVHLGGAPARWPEA